MNIVRKHLEQIPPMSEERAKELEMMSDDNIDYSDIPPLDEEFFKRAINSKTSQKDIDQARQGQNKGLVRKSEFGIRS